MPTVGSAALVTARSAVETLNSEVSPVVVSVAVAVTARPGLIATGRVSVNETLPVASVITVVLPSKVCPWALALHRRWQAVDSRKNLEGEPMEGVLSRRAGDRVAADWRPGRGSSGSRSGRASGWSDGWAWDRRRPGRSPEWRWRRCLFPRIWLPTGSVAILVVIDHDALAVPGNQVCPGPAPVPPIWFPDDAT